MIDWPDPEIRYSNQPGSVSVEIFKINELVRRGKWDREKGEGEKAAIVDDLNRLPF